jgi:hypothetical protein
MRGFAALWEHRIHDLVQAQQMSLRAYHEPWQGRKTANTEVGDPCRPRAVGRRYTNPFRSSVHSTCVRPASSSASSFA